MILSILPQASWFIAEIIFINIIIQVQRNVGKNLHEKGADVHLFNLISSKEQKAVILPYCIFKYFRIEISFCVPLAHKLQ